MTGDDQPAGAGERIFLDAGRVSGQRSGPDPAALDAPDLDPTAGRSMTASPTIADVPAIRPGRARIMGILNVTPDSFSDGGRFDGLPAAVAHATAMVRDGADIIDVGGESTRPGHTPVAADEEKARVLPVIEALAPTIATPISIDTWKASVAEPALAAGASILNDQWALQGDPEIAAVAASFDVETILMHNRTAIDAELDIFQDVFRFFDISLERARKAGLSERRIVLDPGIGFGKTLEQNLQLLKGIDRLKALGFPVLIGLSRKSMIGRLLGVEVGERLVGTLVLDTLALAAGADIIRVHDVAEHVAARTLVEAISHA